MAPKKISQRREYEYPVGRRNIPGGRNNAFRPPGKPPTNEHLSFGAMARSMPLLAYAKIHHMEVDSMSETEQEYRLGLAKTNNRRVNRFTKLCRVSARTLADAIRDYIEKEELVAAVLDCVDLCENYTMSCESLGRIVELLMGYQIQAVDLSSNPQLGDNTVAAIQPLLVANKSYLTDLKLVKCGLTVASLKRLMNIASKSRLRLLDISYIRIRDESELMEQMLQLPMIEELVFRFCDLSPEDVRTIAQDLPFTGVKSVHLGGNTFGSQGLVHLASKLPESMVEELDLTAVGIEAKCEGLSQLASAWVKRPFPKLYLHFNPMGQQEVMNFITTLQTLMPSFPVIVTWMDNVSMRCC